MNIGPQLHINKTVIEALDKTFFRIDGNLQRKFKKIEQDIDTITETYETSDALIVASVALGLAFCNSTTLIIFLCCYYKMNKHQNEQINNYVVKYQKKLTTDEQQCIECQNPMESAEQDLECTHLHCQDDIPTDVPGRSV